MPSLSVRNATQLSGRSAQASAIGVLANSALGREASPATLQALFCAGRLLQVEDGVFLVREGDPVDELQIVVRGHVEGSRVARDGCRHLIGMLAAGQPLHVLPVADRLPSTHDVRTRGDVTLLVIPREAFLAAFDADVGFARAVLRLLAERIRILSTIVGDDALMPLPVRTARTLERLIGFHRLGEPDASDHGVLRLRIGQEELADLMGVTRQSVNRELRALERQGVVRLGRETVDVLDLAALASIANPG